MNTNFNAALDFVWAPGRDSPADGYHVTPGDSGGGTYGGVIEATWAGAHMSGQLKNATRDELASILRTEYWGAACDALPVGLDLLLFNGRMMTGHYPKLFQIMVGLTGDDVDGDIGPETLEQVSTHITAHSVANIAYMLTGGHLAYLSGLSSWAEFGKGWETRILAAEAAAMALIAP